MSTSASTIHVTTWGSEGPEVLLIHGSPQGGPLGGNHHFAAQEALAERGWKLIVPDRPGHGQSPTRGTEDMEVDAVWVAGMLGDGKHLVGHSYGGAIALAAAALRPEAVLSLTLIEPAIADVASDDPAVIAFRDDLETTMASDLEPIPRLMEYRRIVALPDEMIGPAPTVEQVVALGVAIGAMRQPTDWQATPAVEAVVAAGIPVLLVTGGGVPAFEAMADELVRMTDGERLLIPTGHHFPQYDGERFNDALDSFMRAAT